MTDHSQARALQALVQMALEEVPADSSMDAYLFSMVSTLQNPERRSEMRRRMLDESLGGDDMKERKREYDRGYQDCVRAVLQLLDIGVETFPRVPSEITLKRIMDPLTAVEILGSFSRLQDRVSDHVSKEIVSRMEAEASK